MGLSVRRLMLGALFVFVIAFAVFAVASILPPAPYGLADDWRVFYAAAHVVQQGGNPYDPATIHTAEQAAQHYGVVQPSLDDFTDLPVVAVLLGAVAWLPYWWSFALFTALGLVLAGVALHAWMREMGWSRTGLWLTAALCSWPMLLGFFSGQFDALLLAGVLAALLLMRRDSPWLTGACMAVVLFKPHVLWPLPLLVFAAWLPQRERAWRFAAATAATLAGGAIAGFLLVPGAGSFFGHLLGFGGRVGAVQPDLSGIPGLLVHLPQGAWLGDAVALLGAIAVLALAWLAARGSRLQTAGAGRRQALVPLLGLAVWLAATPYAHPNDDVLLYPLLIMVIGERGRLLDARWLQVALVASLGLVAAFLTTPALGYAVLLAGVAFGVARRRHLTVTALAALALAGLALLPAVWPFHVVNVSLTPVAVALTALAGARQLRLGSAAEVVERQASSGHLTATRVVHSVSS